MHTKLILELFIMELPFLKADQLFRVDLLLGLQLCILSQLKELRVVCDLDLIGVG